MVVKRGRRALSLVFLGLIMGLCGLGMEVQPQKAVAAGPPSAHVSMAVLIKGAEGPQNFEIEVWTKEDRLRLDLIFPVPELGSFDGYHDIYRFLSSWVDECGLEP